MNKETKKLKKMVESSFDNLLKAAKKIGKKWNTKNIPLDFMKTLLDTVRLKSDGESTEFIEGYNALLDAMFADMSKTAEAMGVNYVTLQVFEDIIKEVKKAYRE